MAVTTRMGMYLPAGTDIVDVEAHLNNQTDLLEKSVRPEVCTSSTRPVTGLFTGKLIFETDTKNVMKYSGSVWEVLLNENFPRGRVGFASSVGASSTITAGNEIILPSLSVTFTGYTSRRYLILGTASMDAVSGNDCSVYMRARWATGASVTTAGDSLGTQGADYNDNGTGVSMRAEYCKTFVPASSGQMTVGLFMGRPSSGTQSILSTAAYRALHVEDIGAS